MTAALRFEGATLGYGPCPVLRAVDLAVREGELVGVLGPNGSGKTTLVRGATRVVEPAEGAVTLLGRPLGLYDRRELARSVAVVPQEGTPLFPFTVLETVLMGRAPWLRPFAFEGEEDLRAAREALAAVGAADLALRDLAELSGGERQRVVVARALAQGTRVLLADEPTAHLDLRHGVAIFSLLRRLSRERGLAALVVTHDVNLAAIHCDRLVLLSRGAVAAEGTPREVLRADLLAEAYGTPVHVQERPDGSPFVVPVGIADAERGAR
ncbi:MAG: ABC transporter ATP-binding protein [Planctomycetes bacterium]|nr:ABC transporter ATP-binding protein [Planctomycetota bacterium]